MIPMTYRDALAITRNMLADKRKTVEFLSKRIAEVKAEDDDELTLAYIRKLEKRHVHTSLEVEALEILLEETK